tara:strand:- start:30197 stop:31612 length:1416 start_codon:yes stop_codon:yes gene_type:complete
VKRDVALSHLRHGYGTAFRAPVVMLAARGACRRASTRWIVALGGTRDAVADASVVAVRVGRCGPDTLHQRYDHRHPQRRSFAAHSAAVDTHTQTELNDVIDDDKFPAVDPFSLVRSELAAISERMRRAVTSDIPALKTAAEYFFRTGSEGKRVRPTVLLLMASALGEGDLNSSVDMNSAGHTADDLFTPDHAPAHETPNSTRRRQQRLAEVTELIHVASLLHDDVIDGSATRRGLKALNLEVGNKLAILAGDFLLARSSVTLASLRNVEVIELLSRVLEHLVTGEVMQMTAKPESLTSWEHYTRKTYLKTASLIANSSKAVAILGGHESETSQLAYDYGKHLGLAFQFTDDVLDFTGSNSILGKPTLGDLNEGIATAPVLFAAEEFPGLLPLIGRRFRNSGDVEQAAQWVRNSSGVEKTKQLAKQHALFAIQAVDAMPVVSNNLDESSKEQQRQCRRALKELARVAVERIK